MTPAPVTLAELIEAQAEALGDKPFRFMEDRTVTFRGLPDGAKVLVLMCVGYPTESKEAGAQRPRLPFEQLFFLNEVGKPFPRSQQVEELGWGDSGLAVSFGVANFPRMMAQLSGKPDLIERFGDPNSIGCWGGTEPHHGSDFIFFADKVGTPEYGKPDCVARKDGDFFVINGQKAAWVSNGTIASASALFCAVDMGNGVQGSGGLVVPLDVPGVSRGKPLNKIGQRALNQGEIFFEDVRVPADYLVFSPEMHAFAADAILSMANSGMGSTFVGVAQAALELAVDYAKERVQGGAPIFRHQSVRARLFTMFRKVEAARSLSRRVMLYNVLNSPPQLPYAIASKVTATSTAFEVASAALQIFGGNGLSREYPIEKLMRDARASMIEDGCNEVLGLVAAERL